MVLLIQIWVSVILHVFHEKYSLMMCYFQIIYEIQDVGNKIGVCTNAWKSDGLIGVVVG